MRTRITLRFLTGVLVYGILLALEMIGNKEGMMRNSEEVKSIKELVRLQQTFVEFKSQTFFLTLTVAGSLGVTSLFWATIGVHPVSIVLVVVTIIFAILLSWSEGYRRSYKKMFGPRDSPHSLYYEFDSLLEWRRLGLPDEVFPLCAQEASQMTAFVQTQVIAVHAEKQAAKKDLDTLCDEFSEENRVKLKEIEEFQVSDGESMGRLRELLLNYDIYRAGKDSQILTAQKVLRAAKDKEDDLCKLFIRMGFTQMLPELPSDEDGENPAAALVDGKQTARAESEGGVRCEGAIPSPA